MLVGRETELAAIARNIEAGIPTLVVGEAGVGKTTLLRAAAARTGLTIREGGALRMLSWSPYLVFERALDDHFDGGDRAYVETKVDAALKDAALVADDLQWAHRSTLDLLHAVAGRHPLLGAVRLADGPAEDVISALEGAGFAKLELVPLDDAAARALLARLRPELSRTSVARLIRRTGGNPLLLEELASTDEPSESLRLAIRARLRNLPDDAKRGSAMLAVADRPLEASAIEGAERLVAAGLVEETAAGLTLRHALIAELIAGDLDDGELRGVHARLVDLANDARHVAVHLAASGRTREAMTHALEAAAVTTWPHERASLLGLAATCADDSEQDELRLLAAQELTAADEFDRSDEVLGSLDGYAGDRRAEACLVAARNAYARGEQTVALDLVEDASLCATTGGDVDLAVTIQRLAFAPLADGPQAAVTAAMSAWERADELGALRAWARVRLATISLMTRAPGWEAHMRAAASIARDERDTVSEMQASANLSVGLQWEARLQEARDATAALLARTRELRLVGWQRRIAIQNMAYQLTYGEFDDLIAEARELIDQPLDPRMRAEVVSMYAYTLMLRGRYDEALMLIDAVVPAAPDDMNGRWRLLYTKACVLLWSGRPAAALRLAEETLDLVVGTWIEPMLRLAIAWALFELGRDPGEPIETDIATYAASVVEWKGLQQLAAERPVDAAGHFKDVVAQLENAEVSTRNLWMLGESQRLAGDQRAARGSLERAEQRATEFAIEPLLARIRRSLRLVGTRRSSQRTGGRGDLTGREREVLTLVRVGLTNPEIARRLGVSVSTVARLISSASRKLGTKTRHEAAAVDLMA